MTISCVIGHSRSMRLLLPCLLALLLPNTAHAQQAPPLVTPRPVPMVLVPPPAAVQFQQTAQQQQVRDQLQKSQLQQQLQQGVSDNAKRPLPVGSPNRQQMDQADAARQARNRAAQQDLVDHYRDAAASPPASQPQPASTNSTH